MHLPSIIVGLLVLVIGTDAEGPVRARRLASEIAVKRQSAATNTACAIAASAASSYIAAVPSATDVEIPAHLAHDCLQSIPNRPGPAIDLLNALEAILEFQSDKDTWLLNPPEGFLFPGVNIDQYMQTIKQNVVDGNYDSEYDFQLDIQTMMLDAKNGHLYWNGDATTLFTFRRPVALASISATGLGTDLPYIYVLSDLVSTNENGTELFLNTGYSPSPVKLINDIDVLTFLLSECLVGSSQDPDALYNSQHFQLAKAASDLPSFFERPHFFPDDTTNISFANGTSRTFRNTALVNVDLANIQNGEMAYETFCDPANKEPGTKRKRQASSASPSISLPFYPKPVISDPSNVVSGYYLPAPFSDVAVLALSSFEPVSQGGEAQFQAVVQQFLEAAVQSDKRKLIVDLQGNGGGYIDLGLDTFTQLFPSLKPDVKSNMRTSLGMKLLAETSAQIFEGDIGNMNLNETEVDLAEITPFAYQSVMTPEGHNFPTLNSFYGPLNASGGQFTNFFQNNYSDPHQSDILGEGIIITGTNNRTHFLQPFAARDVIMLLDGYCASTCTTFSEFMKNYAKVQSITIGGRPQTGPAQGVGGIKAAQVAPLTSFEYWIQIFDGNKDVNLQQANGTVFENFTNLVFQRSNPNVPGGVNLRSSFRIGDSTETPLQYVYEASDCRLWWTQEMLYDPTFLWKRVAELAFRNRTGTQFSSPYCVEGSTGHPTSINGGWKQGTLGPQTPPANAKLQDKGWIVNGTTITMAGPAEEEDPVVVAQDGEVTTAQGNGSATTSPQQQPQIHKSQAITNACNAWHGDVWLVKMVCAVLSA